MSKKREVKSVKTSNANLNSLPKSQRSKYLDLFKLEKQKEILTTANEILRCKLEKNLIKLADIQKQIEEIEQVQSSPNQVSTVDLGISDDRCEDKFKLRMMKLGY